MFVRVCLWVGERESVCVCVCERERERERARTRGIEKTLRCKAKGRACACVYKRERRRERKRKDGVKGGVPLRRLCFVRYEFSRLGTRCVCVC